MRSLLPALAAAVLIAPGAALADEATEAFVEANVLAVLYHELGHALIDIEGVPIFGQEEDAADVFSILLIDAFYEEEAAVSLAYDTAFGFLGEAERSRAEGIDPAFWDVHGPDEQRYYNTVCLFYGANPDERDDVAEELGLPEDRAETCPEEFDQAQAAWGAVLDEMAEGVPAETIRVGVLDPRYGAIAELISGEVEALNADFALSADLVINLEDCGEANAFYYAETTSITICTEFIDDLAELAP
ncbi:MAG: hypothetical protein KDK10_17555 [Maritimibacter sp.]|nr:hypothetical protein [Maritimibacter sp.]